jgi:hypothetical protein
MFLSEPNAAVFRLDPSKPETLDVMCTRRHALSARSPDLIDPECLDIPTQVARRGASGCQLVAGLCPLGPIAI